MLIALSLILCMGDFGVFFGVVCFFVFLSVLAEHFLVSFLNTFFCLLRYSCPFPMQILKMLLAH